MTASVSQRAVVDKFYNRLLEIARTGDCVAFCREVLEFEPHEEQRKWYRNATRRENAMVAGNRGGKSTGEAARKIFECATLDGWTSTMIARYKAAGEPYHAINIAMTASQSKYVWEKAFALVSKPTASWLLKPNGVKMTPFPRMEFRNGAILEARNTARRGHYLLGAVYDRASWDEVAYDPNFEYIRDTILKMRMVDRGGKIDYVTTGNGRNAFGQFFLKGLERNDPDLYCQNFSSRDNPHISHDDLEKTAAGLSDRLRRQNVEGQIVELGGLFFSAPDIDAALDSDMDVRVIMWDEEDREKHAIVYVEGATDEDGVGHGGREWAARYPSHRYVHGWDLADKSDWTVGQTWDLTTMPHTLVEFERFHKSGWSHVYDRIRVRDSKYQYGETWIDATGVGDPVMDELSDIGVQGVKFTDNALGTGKKSEMLTNIQSLLSLRELKIPPIRALLEELRFYSQPDKGLIKDCVMSLAVSAEGMRLGGGEAFASEV